jgi:hypothetical protein
MGGYKTLYSSRELPKSLAERLDRFSTETYDKVSGASPRELFFVNEGFICLSMKFVNGSDHVGRMRTCVHNVLIHTHDVADIPFFNPLSLPEGLFLPPEADLQHLSRYLQRVHLFEEGEFVYRLGKLTKNRPPAPLVRNLLLALLSGRSTVILRGAASSTVKVLETLTAFLPPALRSHLGLIAFYPIKDYLVSLENNVSIILLPRKEPVETFIKDGFVVIDLVEKTTYNIPQQNAFADFIVTAIYEKGKLAEAVKLLKILENYRISTIPTAAHYDNFFSAYFATADCFTPAGNIDIGLELGAGGLGSGIRNPEPQAPSLKPQSPIRCLESVLDFYKSGYWNIALDIIEKTFRLIIQKRYFRSFDETKAKALGTFIDFLLDILQSPHKPKTTLTLTNRETKTAAEFLKSKIQMSEISEDIADFET